MKVWYIFLRNDYQGFPPFEGGREGDIQLNVFTLGVVYPKNLLFINFSKNEKHIEDVRKKGYIEFCYEGDWQGLDVISQDTKLNYYR